MLFMVVESIGGEQLARVGNRFREHGRMLPEGVAYVDSWVTPDGSTCFQLMHAPDRAALQAWVDRWSDLVTFEIFEVLRSVDFWNSARE